jgi:DNA-directed RNA polymerase specialized sigma24 family protein
VTLRRARTDLAEIESAYASAYRRYVRLTAAVSGRSEDAADLVQEAFARAVRSRESFRGDGPIEGWIARIVVNVARDEARRPPSPAPVPAESRDGDEPSGIGPIVAALPERQRLVLFPRYYADLSYAAIAQAPDLNASTVGPTLTAALRTLRARMSEVGT